jgi:hypothetical protein
MRIVLTTEGGLAFVPGLSRPVVIDSHDRTARDLLGSGKGISGTHGALPIH